MAAINTITITDIDAAAATATVTATADNNNDDADLIPIVQDDGQSDEIIFTLMEYFK